MKGRREQRSHFSSGPVSKWQDGAERKKESHLLPQSAPALRLTLHPLPERVGPFSIDFNFTEHVELHTVTSSKSFDLLVSAWFLFYKIV